MSKLDLVIVTGASRGIGKQVALSFADLSCPVIAVGSSELIKQTDFGKTTQALQLDISNFTEVETKLGPYVKTGTKPRIAIVLCASQIGSPGGLFTSDLNEWLELYKTNVLGNLCVLKQVISALSPEAFLRVVFFAGGGAAYGYPDFSGYALTKAATVRAVENVAMEFNEKKLNASIVALAPGAVATDMLAKVIANGGMIKTKTDISEPVEFVRKFVFDEIPSRTLNGRFVHVRDDVNNLDFSVLGDDHFKLRRVQ